MLSHPQSEIIFKPLLNLSENCITNLGRRHEQIFNLSSPQGQINDVKYEESQ